MKLVKIQTDKGKDSLISMISDNARVNEGVKFNTAKGTPHMHVKEKGGRVRIVCEMRGRATRDNGFGYLVGTFFSGKIKEKNGAATLSGIIITAPIYHAIMIALLAVFIYQCIKAGGISVVPILLVAFEVIFFFDEFKKQGYISRYLYRAERRLNKQ